MAQQQDSGMAAALTRRVVLGSSFRADDMSLTVCRFCCAGDSLMAQQQDPGMVSALTRALTQLMTSNGVQQSLDRQNRRAFRANLRAFVAEARSIVRRR